MVNTKRAVIDFSEFIVITCNTQSVDHTCVTSVFIPQQLTQFRIRFTHGRFANLSRDHIIIAPTGNIFGYGIDFSFSASGTSLQATDRTPRTAGLWTLLAATRDFNAPWHTRATYCGHAGQASRSLIRPTLSTLALILIQSTGIATCFIALALRARTLSDDQSIEIFVGTAQCTVQNSNSLLRGQNTAHTCG